MKEIYLASLLNYEKFITTNVLGARIQREDSTACYQRSCARYSSLGSLTKDGRVQESVGYDQHLST